MKRLAMFTGLLIWSNLLEADVISPAVVSLDISLDRYDSIKVDWYVPMILMVAILGIVSIYVLRWMRTFRGGYEAEGRMKWRSLSRFCWQV